MFPGLKLSSKPTPNLLAAENAAIEQITDKKFHEMQNLIGCRICLQVLDDPIECQECRSLFCSACINAYNATQRRPSCVMRCKVNFKPAHWSVKSLLNELQLTCNNTERGCTKVLSYESMKKHIKECDFGWVACSAKPDCTVEGLRSEMKVHDDLCGLV